MARVFKVSGQNTVQSVFVLQFALRCIELRVQNGAEGRVCKHTSQVTAYSDDISWYNLILYVFYVLKATC